MSKWFTKSEAADALGVNPRRIDYLTELGKIKDNGKTGKARRFFVESSGNDDSDGEDMDSAKLRKTIAEANLKELQVVETKRAYLHQATEIIISSISANFEAYSRALSKSKIPELAEVYDQCWEATRKDVLTKLEALYVE